MIGLKSRNCALATVTLALAACGGGDDGGGGSTQAPPVAITAANAPAVGAETVDASNTALTSALPILTGVQLETAVAPTASAMATLAGALRLGLQVRAPRALVGATFNETIQCPGGGSADVSGNDASEERISVGDSFDATFRNCVMQGTTVNGRMSARVASVNAPETLIVADITATDLTATLGASGGRLNGTPRITIDETNAAFSRLTVTGNVTSDRLRNGAVRATRTLTDYMLAIQLATATGTSSTTFGFKADGTFPAFGSASFDVATTQALVTPAGATRPTSGVVKVTGASGSTVVMTVVGTGVRLDVDADGNGTAESTQNLTWAQLEAQL